jgi:hypothetical protein
MIAVLKLPETNISYPPTVTIESSSSKEAVIQVHGVERATRFDRISTVWTHYKTRILLSPMLTLEDCEIDYSWTLSHWFKDEDFSRFDSGIYSQPDNWQRGHQCDPKDIQDPYRSVRNMSTQFHRMSSSNSRYIAIHILTQLERFGGPDYSIDFLFLHVSSLPCQLGCERTHTASTWFLKVISAKLIPKIRYEFNCSPPRSGTKVILYSRDTIMVSVWGLGFSTRDISIAFCQTFGLGCWLADMAVVGSRPSRTTDYRRSQLPT